MADRRTILVVPEKGQCSRDREFLAGLVGRHAHVMCHREDELDSTGCVHGYGGGNLAPCRSDLADIALNLVPARTDVHVAWPDESFPPYLATTFRLLGFREITHVHAQGETVLSLPPMPERDSVRSLLLKASGGIGNVVLASFVLSASLGQGWDTYFCPVSDADGGSLADLYSGDVPANLTVLPPSELPTIAPDISLNIEDHANRLEADFFHGPYRVGIEGHEPGFAAQFFENVTGVTPSISATFIGGVPAATPPTLRDRIVVCPGSKTGWDSKRWPHMNELIRQLDNPVVLCRPDDLDRYASLDFLTTIDTEGVDVITDMSLAEATSLLKSARAVIANDCGPAHMAAAAGVPTLVLFGPSSLIKNRHDRANVRAVSLGLDCQPCQGRNCGPGRLGPGVFECSRDFECLAKLGVERVLAELGKIR